MTIKYPEERAVSIWVGTFSSENDFDLSVDRDVARQLGLNTPIESICEVSFEDAPVEIQALLEGFSGYETFIDSAVVSATRLGVKNANAALICYYLRCEQGPPLWGHLQFLGSFEGQDAQ